MAGVFSEGCAVLFMLNHHVTAVPPGKGAAFTPSPVCLSLSGLGPTQRLSEATTWSLENKPPRKYFGESSKSSFSSFHSCFSDGGWSVKSPPPPRFNRRSVFSSFKLVQFTSQVCKALMTWVHRPLMLRCLMLSPVHPFLPPLNVYSLLVPIKWRANIRPRCYLNVQKYSGPSSFVCS